MERYKNLGGNSGIDAFEIQSDGIIVEFSDGSAYLYDESSTGLQNVEEMKALAAAGRRKRGEGKGDATSLSK